MGAIIGTCGQHNGLWVLVEEGNEEVKKKERKPKEEEEGRSLSKLKNKL